MTKLTIILGKNLWKLDDLQLGQLIHFPEVFSPAPGVVVPRHPDDFIGQTVEDIRLCMLHGIDVQLWTLSEYLVSCIAQDVAEYPTYWQEGVTVRLYADDNQSWQDFGISQEGVIRNTGDGDWPIGWFMPSN